jgi:hypothetical protein
MDHNKLHNPAVIGPGKWHTFHSMACDAKTPEEKQIVINLIRKEQSRFPCGDCKGHFSNYLESNPPEVSLNGSPESLFAWTVSFHNAVNYRLGKPQMSYDEAKSVYMNDHTFCMASHEHKEPTQPKLVPKDMTGYVF